MTTKIEKLELSERELSLESKQEIGRLALREKERREENIKYLKSWAGEYRSVEHTFSKRAIGKNLKEYEKWEEDACFYFEKIEKLEEKLGFEGYYDPYERDEIEKIPGMVKGENSIEAYAGHFYDKRNRDIINAIRNSDDKDREEDEDTVTDLYRLVAEYIQCSKDRELRRTDVDRYQKRRQKAHNNVIRQLNEINDLARYYGVKPLTFRNFETNNFAYNLHKDIHRETDARKEYDRSAVMGYMEIAFSEEFNKADQGNGDQYYDSSRSIVQQFHGED